ncbi:hypothetical protein BVC93_25095 [Mycobacterium sp. MS1601]|nr:hypothetical protein BVC93_25095 [Mycobacterium sp. MS1601]
MVVGVDGSAGSMAAVRWAAGEAAGLRLPLRLVYAIDPDDATTALPTGTARLRSSAQSTLEQAENEAQRVAPQLDVECLMVNGRPAVTLAGLGRPAMICVGASAPAVPHPGHHANVVTELILAADCPVVVFQDEPPGCGWVVAEVGADPDADNILRFAVGESLRRGFPLKVVAGPYREGELTSVELRRRIERSLSRWQTAHPELDALVVTETWELEQYLKWFAPTIALFIAPRLQVHQIGTVLHPTAARALAVLDCPVVIYTPGP